jgi:TonB family protein
MRSRFAWSLALVAAFGLPQVILSAGQDTFGQGAVRPGPGISVPALLKKIEPKYTAEAMRAKIQGTVELEAVIRADGTVGEVRVIRSLDKTFGLDLEAIAAAREWRFTPGRRDGQPVPVIVVLLLEFRLHSQGPVPDSEFLRGAYPSDGPGVVAPTAIRMVEAKYTSDAMRAKLQGVVEVEAVVMPDGTVGRARVSKSLDRDLGLDAMAVAAALQWTFTPGTLNGQPVPVVVKVNQAFRIH